MAIKLANGDISGLYLGSTAVSAAYLGSTSVWSAGGGGGGWDISSATFVQSFSVAAQETQPTGLYIKPDGTKMYVCGYASDKVSEYSLSAAWDISTAFFSQDFSVISQATNGRAIFFKPDGAKMFVANLNGNTYEYDLSSPWSVSSALYGGNSVVLSNGSNVFAPSIEGIYFKPDGTSVWGLTRGGGDDVVEYSLPSAWSLSGASRVRQMDLQVAGGPGSTTLGLTFKIDGTSFFITSEGTDTLDEYVVSTPWDITTASFLRSVSTAAQDATMQSPFFKPDGSALYIVGRGSDRVYQYSL